jgi:hypothetical protein
MSKLIPLRRDAVGGLIHLVDVVNVLRFADGVARTVESTEPGAKRFVVYDGRTVASVDGAPVELSELEAGRILAVRLEPSDR